MLTRESYLQMRNNGSIEPFYEYYKENWTKEKHIFFLDSEQFFQAMNLWPRAQEKFGNVLDYYDHKFTVQKVQDLKTGQIIKYM